MNIKIHRLSPFEFNQLTPIFVDLYLQAMNYDSSIRDSRIKAWRSDSQEHNFQAFCAHDDQHALGITYGFSGRPHQWWDKEVRRGLREHGGANFEQLTILADYFSVAEIHVSPKLQGQGIGTQLLRAILEHAPAPYALLSTPEVANEDNHAFHLYHAFEFRDLLRNFYFRGDDRPFAVLYKKL